MSWYQYPQEIFSWFDFVGVLALRWLYAVKPYVLYEAIRGNNTNTLHCFYPLHNSKIIQVFVVNPLPFLPCLAFSGAACHSGYPEIGRHQPGAIWSNDPYISFILIPGAIWSNVSFILIPFLIRVAGVGWLLWTAAESLRAFVERVFANFRDNNVVFYNCGKKGHLWLSKDLHTHTGTFPQTPF